MSYPETSRNFVFVRPHIPRLKHFRRRLSSSLGALNHVCLYVREQIVCKRELLNAKQTCGGDFLPHQMPRLSVVGWLVVGGGSGLDKCRLDGQKARRLA